MSKRSGSEKRIMTESWNFRVDPDLYERIRYAAEREGMSPASWARLVCAAAAGDDLKAMPRKPTPKPKPKVFRAAVDAPELAPFLFEINRLGRNINQVATLLHKARRANVSLPPYIDKMLQDLEDLGKLLHEIEAKVIGKDE